MGDLGDLMTKEDHLPYLKEKPVEFGSNYSLKMPVKDLGFDADMTHSNVLEFVRDMEEQYPTLTNEFKRIQIKQYVLFLQKHHDYGLHNIDMNEDTTTEEGRIFPTLALVIRIRDKVERLKNIVKKGITMVGNESLIDTFKDLSVYGIIAQIVNSGKWKRG